MAGLIFFYSSPLYRVLDVDVSALSVDLVRMCLNCVSAIGRTDIESGNIISWASDATRERSGG